MKKINDFELQSELKKYKKPAVLFTILNSLNAVLLVFFAYCSKNVINLAIAGENLTLWIVLLIVTGALIPTLKGVTSFIVSYFSDKKIALVRSILFKKLLIKDSLKLSELKNGEILNRLMSDSRSLVTYYTTFIPNIIGELIQLVASLGLIVIIRPLIGLIVLGLGLIALVVMYFIRVLLKKEEKKALKSYDEVTSFISEGIDSVETLKIVADKDEVSSRLDTKHKKFLKEVKILRLLGISSTSLFSLSVQIVSVSLIIFGAIKISSGEMNYGDFAALIELVALFKSPISALTGVGNSLAAFDASKDRINTLLSIDDSKDEVSIEPNQIKSIEFKNVSFAYENEEIIKDYSTVIKMNNFSRFSGDSGKGKTTLFKLLLGIYSPLKGKIVLNLEDDKSVDITSKSIVNQFAYVPQSCLIFSGTIFENLRLSNPRLSKEEAKEALSEVNLGTFDLDYQIKENMDGLSRGEAQRLCIARAIVSKRPFLLLDEATSSLDDKNSKEILLKLSKRYKTIIFSSHKEEDLKGLDFKEIKL